MSQNTKSQSSTPQITERHLDSNLVKLLEIATGFTGVAIIGIGQADQSQQKSLIILRNVEKFNEDFNAFVGSPDKGPAITFGCSTIKLCTW